MACSGLRSILSRLLWLAAEAVAASLLLDDVDVLLGGRVVLVEDLALAVSRADRFPELALVMLSRCFGKRSFSRRLPRLMST